jgi:hypothetical protein
MEMKDKIKEHIERNIERIPECGCWIWMACYNSGGYGLLSISGRKCRVHRIIWELYNGPIVKGMYVLHRCDTPSCVNPHHLFLGTHTDNMRDMIKKGRGRCVGEKNTSTILSNKSVLKIREDNRIYKLISKDFGISVSTISHIKTGRSWSHLKG